jgi:hypothetical protein
MTLSRPIGRRTADARLGGPAWRQHGGQARQAQFFTTVQTREKTYFHDS